MESLTNFPASFSPIPTGTPSLSAPFRVRLRTAIEEGLLLGIKGMLAVVLTLWAVSWALGDYVAVRQRAAAGQRAFEVLQAIQSQQQAAKLPAAPQPTPAP